MKKRKKRYDKQMEAKLFDLSTKNPNDEEVQKEGADFISWASAAGYDYIFRVRSPDDEINSMWCCIDRDLGDLLIDITSRGFTIDEVKRIAPETAFGFESN